MNERVIQLAIISTMRSACLCACPNYTPIDWWECDVWLVTKAGYVTEYEIKVSAADFRADRNKDRRVIRLGMWQQANKHREIGSESGPSRFYYVVPNALAELESEVPEWAGFAVLRSDKDPRFGIRILKDAPKLHAKKVRKREIELAKRRMWYRYWDSLASIQKLIETAAGRG